MAMAEFFFLNGAFHHVDGPLPKGAQRVPRMPEVGEAWDIKAQDFVRDDVAIAHHALPADHIARAHAIKAIEAVLILSGVPLTHGLIVEEAAALGIDPPALAAAVHAQGEAMRRAEVNRRTAKASASKE